MTPEHTQIIKDRLSQGPASSADLAGELLRRSDIEMTDLYQAVYRSTNYLIEQGQAERHVSGCFIWLGK